MKFVINLQKVTKSDVRLTGGKGASLGEMLRAGMPVPPGFVILSTAFEKFLEEAGLDGKIDDLLETIDYRKVRSVENASKKIQSLIGGSVLPADISEEIGKSFDKLGGRYVAVRSSATAEDSANAAWAGQLESYLNTTKKDLLGNIKRCWASLYAPQAIFYRKEKNLRRQKISVAVVVQKMVKSEVSGVAFSVHPVTQNKRQILIEAGLGLGEAVVSGKITPDSYVIDKDRRVISDKNTDQQNAKIVRSSISDGKRPSVIAGTPAGQKSSDSDILELADLIVKIENHFDYPVDVEWARAKGKYYITQSRPITTLRKLTENRRGIFEYLKSQRWFWGVRAEDALLLYSAKRRAYTRYIKKEYGIVFAETLLVPLKKNYPVRVFNLWQAKEFHAISNEKILRNPQVLAAYIEQNDCLWQDMEVCGKKLITAAEADDYRNSIRSFRKILGLYEIANAQFFIIFSLGLKLAENRDRLKNLRGLTRRHDTWRNSIAFRTESLSKSLLRFLEYFASRRKFTLDSSFLLKYLTMNEIEAWISGRLTDSGIRSMLKSRKDHGFVYLDLRDEKREVIDRPAEVARIQQYFSKLDHESQKSKSKDRITGQVAYGRSGLLRGKVIVIQDKSELKSKSHLIAGKILVATQTTPHYIPYLKGAKAIITDEGGLTCHAAIVAREFGIPCIVGTRIATRILKNNDLIEIDASDGIIRIKK